MRKICIFTGTRAEYGSLYRLMKEIREDSDLELQIIATGMHLSPEFGMTIQEIRADGFEPDETIEILLSGDTPTAVCKSMGLGLISYGDAIQRLQPDIVLLLGDRFEAFCMAAAALVCRVPVAHIHGGETTEGAIDEAFRHSITKMAHLHFASCEAYRQRIIQLGEHPDRVFNVGAIGVENIKSLPLLSREDLEKDIGFDLGDQYLLVTFHPVTLERSTAEDHFKNLLKALDKVTSDSNELMKIIFTKANADTDGRVINYLIDDYASEHSDKAIAFTSMGQLRYLSAMKYASVVIGNSSSGIVEAPCFAVPTVNIGDRQQGRERVVSIIDCDPTRKSVLQSLQKALTSTFRDSLSGMVNPYEKEKTAVSIVDIIKKCDLSKIIKKKFFNLPCH